MGRRGPVERGDGRGVARSWKGWGPPSRLRGSPVANRRPQRGARAPAPAPHTLAPRDDVDKDIERILYREEDILEGIERVAAEVTEQYRGREFTVVSVLKGSCVFASDLIRRIPIPLELAFVSASSYGDGTESGKLEMNYFPTEGEIEGRSLLLVDDILDTGRTLDALGRELMKRGAAEVRTCVFLDKPARRAVEFDADFRCFEVENLFVVGYGLDYAGRYRNLPFVGALRAEIYSQVAADAEGR